MNPVQPGSVRLTDHLPRDLVIDVHAVGLHLVISLSGDLDLHTAPQLHRELQAQARRGHDLIAVDISEVTFLDSVALGVLIGARNELAEVNGRLTVICGNERLLRIFRLTGLERVFTMQASVAALD